MFYTLVELGHRDDTAERGDCHWISNGHEGHRARSSHWHKSTDIFIYLGYATKYSGDKWHYYIKHDDKLALRRARMKMASIDQGN